MIVPLAALPFLLIPYDSLTYLLGLDPGETSQTLPFTAAFSLAYLVLRRGRLWWSPTGVRVFRRLSAAALCIAFVTIGNIVAENFGIIGIDESMRAPTALRQGASLVLGLVTFLMFQDALLRIGWRAAYRWIVLGGLPSLALCGLQIAQGNFRIQGFSAEPSLLGDMLVFAFLPACAFANLKLRYRVPLITAGSFSLLASFSGTGILKAAFAGLSFSFVRGQIVRGLILVVCALSLTYGVLLLYPDNYIFMLFNLFKSFLESGKLVGGSFIDRFFGFTAPVGMLSQPHGWFGFGLGGDTVYFDRIFDEETAAAIRLEKNSIASISSLQAKMLLYGGLLGYGFYLAAWWAAWRATPKAHPARFMIPTAFAASVFSLGPFFLPYIWLWLAFGSTSRERRTYAGAVDTVSIDPDSADRAGAGGRDSKPSLI
jgi:hypothetical protein